MTSPQLITGVARAANWALAAFVLAAAGGALIDLGATWPAAALSGIYLLLGLGALWRRPLAYLLIAMLSFLFVAADMERTEFAAALIHAVLFVLALFVRSQLRIRRP